MNKRDLVNPSPRMPCGLSSESRRSASSTLCRRTGNTRTHTVVRRVTLSVTGATYLRHSFSVLEPVDGRDRVSTGLALQHAVGSDRDGQRFGGNDFHLQDRGLDGSRNCVFPLYQSMGVWTFDIIRCYY